MKVRNYVAKNNWNRSKVFRDKKKEYSRKWRME